MKKGLIIFSALLVVVLALTGAFFTIHINKVSASGSRFYTESEIINAQMNNKFSYNTLWFFAKEKLLGPEKMPFAQEINISFPDMHTVKIRVYDKKVSGCVKTADQYAYFDMDGNVLACLDRREPHVTIVTGVELKSFTVGKKLDVKDDAIFKQIMNVTGLIEHYNINADSINTDDRSITLYAGDVKVLLGKKDFYDDQMSVLASVLETARKNKLSGTIDMTDFKPGDKIFLDK
ncbi:MAG: hypothetical protein VZR23_07660 [Lachnospiraceae bacterium]|jgi:cell division protein FtsQ|nr:hypothetical protein [Lachnospiraceae bacterium]